MILFRFSNWLHAEATVGSWAATAHLQSHAGLLVVRRPPSVFVAVSSIAPVIGIVRPQRLASLTSDEIYQLQSETVEQLALATPGGVR